MRIITRLKIIAGITIAALLVLAPVLIWSFSEFTAAKNDSVLCDEIKVNFFERASFRDQYFLYREDRARAMWFRNSEAAASLLRRAAGQFRGQKDKELLHRLQVELEDSAAIFQRIVDNTASLQQADGNRAVYEELDKRLFSQLLLRSSSIRDLATMLQDESARRVEQTYKNLTLIIGLFAVTLALSTILSSIQLGRLMRKRLAALHDGAKKVADGNLDFRLDEHGANEFAELAASINTMTAKLQAFTRKLEAEIGVRKQSEIALRDSEEKLQAVLNASEVAIAWANEAGKIEYVNPKFISLFGYTLEDVPTVEQWYQHAYPIDSYREKMVGIWNERVENSLANRCALEPLEVQISCKDGSVRYCMLMGSWAGKRLLANFSDITEIKLSAAVREEALGRLHKIASRIPGMVYQFLLRPDGSSCFPFASEAIREIYRVTPEEVSQDASRVFAILHPDDLGDVVASIQKSATEMTPWRHEYRVKFDDGDVRWLFGNALPQQEADGSVLWHGFITDISERKQAEQALQRESEKNLVLLRNASDGIHILDSDGNIIEVSDSFCSMLGYTREEMIGMNVSRWDAQFSDAERMQLVENQFSQRSRSQFETLHRRKDGSIFNVEVSGSPLLLDGKPALFNSSRDITERKKIEEKISELNRDFISFLENSSDFIYFKDVNSRIRFCSQTLADITGHASWRDMIGKNDRELFPEDTAQIYYEEELPIFREGKPLLNKIDPYYDAEGNAGWINTSKWPLFDSQGKVTGLFGISRDISVLKKAEDALRESESRFRIMADTAPVLIWVASDDQLFSWVNKVWLEFTGRSLEEEMGKGWLQGIHPDDLQRCLDTYADAFATRQEFTMEYRLRRHDGEYRWLVDHGVARFDAQGAFSGYIGSAVDITARHEMEEQIRRLAHFDPLTELPNRTLLSDRLQQALAIARRDKSHLALMFLDLDKFKPINDALGHHVGDLLLREAAKRMQDCVRESDTVARLGGDEFVVLLPFIEAESDAVLVAEKIRHALNQSFALVGQNLSISSSTGVAVYPEHGKNEPQLMKNADIAMYHAKENGRNQVVVYHSNMQNSEEAGKSA